MSDVTVPMTPVVAHHFDDAEQQREAASLGMWKLGVLFFFAVFGIYLGWFSPTEAAAVAAFVAILIGLATRSMGWRDLIDCFFETVYTTASIFIDLILPGNSASTRCSSSPCVEPNASWSTKFTFE